MKVSFARSCVAAAVEMAVLFLVGCSSQSELPVYPVHGKVLIKGDPATGALVVFHPLNQTKAKSDQVIPRPSAIVDEDGSFALTTQAPRDGARAGKYQVSIVWFKNATNSEGSLGAASSEPRAGSKDFFQGKYSHPDKSGLSVTVMNRVNELEPFELE